MKKIILIAALLAITGCVSGGSYKCLCWPQNAWAAADAPSPSEGRGSGEGAEQRTDAVAKATGVEIKILPIPGTNDFEIVQVPDKPIDNRGGSTK